MTAPIKTVIGFDFGSHWIGVAIGQTLTRQARPLAAVKNNDWQAIERMLREWQPEQLVVGLPLSMEGGPQEMTAAAKRFSRRLEGRFKIKTALTDERLTTREAYQMATAGDVWKSKPEIDSLAAVLITESWLRNHDSETATSTRP